MKFLSLNSTARIFFLRLIVVILLWEGSCHFILKPLRIPDKLLTNIVTAASTKGINLFFVAPAATWQEDPGQRASNIVQNGRVIFSIYDSCNGLDLIAIYLLLIILLPYSFRRKIIFGIGGIVAIIMANVLRCISLYWIFYRHRYIFEFNHHYVFTILMYLVIFSGWILFTKTTAHEID